MNSVLFLSDWGRKLGKEISKSFGKKKLEYNPKKWNIVKGDMVKVIQGPLEGQEGKVLAVIRKKNRVIIEDVNMRRRIVKKDPQTPGKIVLKPCSIHYSNVMLVDPKTGQPTKVYYRYLEDGTKVRMSKVSGHIIPKPDITPYLKVYSKLVGPKDTTKEDTFEVTFDEYEKYLPHIYKRWREE
mmetsp:Transcript_2576/g.2549  ORF Transcript_2576/g.2549 Transcript_2576/m.2549 type:complete len:183 (-) Transcript_2576:137-685(-)